MTPKEVVALLAGQASSTYRDVSCTVLHQVYAYVHERQNVVIQHCCFTSVLLWWTLSKVVCHGSSIYENYAQKYLPYSFSDYGMYILLLHLKPVLQCQWYSSLLPLGILLTYNVASRQRRLKWGRRRLATLIGMFPRSEEKTGVWMSQRQWYCSTGSQPARPPWVGGIR